MNIRFIGLAALLLASQASLAQAPYASAFPTYDYAGYPQSGYNYAPAYNGNAYDSGYSNPAYGNYSGYAPGYGSGYGSAYAPAYAAPAYNAYSYAPAYYPPPPPPPRRDRYKAKGLNKLLRINKEVLGEKGVGEDLWPGRPGNMWEDVMPVSGPWNNDWGHAPWNRDYSRTWGRKGGPDAWFDPSDPKEGAAQMWEDMINTPHGVGTQPGGWQAPSISVPNPIDVGEEFKNTAKDMPNQMQNLSEGFTYGGNSWDGNKGNNDGGGITFNPNRNRR